MEGLDGPVTIDRDEWGIPHVWATNLADLFFGQGFATAVDRLWHLEWDRRRALGTLAAVTGDAGHAVADGFARRARLADAAQRGYASLDAPTRGALDAHAAGINAYLSGVADRPLELRTLRVEPGPWEPWHAVAVFLVRHVTFATWQSKLWRARVLAAQGPTAVGRWNIEGFVGDTPVIVPPGARAAVGELDAAGLLSGGPAAETIAALRPLGMQMSGSNCWALTGARTAAGRPLIAGDPHRPLEVPNVYYQVRLTCLVEGIEAAGFSFPGVPGIQHFGQNAFMAWGVTNAMADYQDLYVERLPDAVTDRRTETVEVAGGDPIEIECLTTRHGPVVVGGTEHGVGVALASTGLVEPAGSLRLIVPLLQTRSVAALDAALADWVEPLNNFVLADRQGAVGYRTAGKVPVRTAVNAWLPVPGWVTDHDWLGTIPDAELPRATNPAIGAVVTANQRVTERDYPHLLGTDAYGPGRAQRIWDRLGDRGDLDVADQVPIHTDTLTRAGLRFAALSGHPVLENWNGQMDAASAPAALYALAKDALVKRVTGYLPEALRVNPFAAWEPPSTAFPAELRVANSIDGWIAADDAWLLPDGAAWVDEIRAAVAAAEATWQGRTWGDLHELTPLHPLRRELGDVVRPTSGPISGAAGCVMATNHIPGVSHGALTGSTARYVWDLADPGRSGWVVPLGASGDPASDHFVDQTAAYAAGHLFPVESPPVDTLDLLPGSSVL